MLILVYLLLPRFKKKKKRDLELIWSKTGRIEELSSSWELDWKLGIADWMNSQDQFDIWRVWGPKLDKVRTLGSNWTF